MAEESSTIIVRHFPSDLTAEEKEDLLKHFGAIRVRCMSDTGRMKHMAFASFCNNEDAKYALSRLHQLEVLGCRLIVEYARSQHQKYFPHESDIPRIKQESEDTADKAISEKEEMQMKMEEFSKKLHGVAPALGLDYLPSPLLKYKYPVPTPSVITNIAHTLAAVPKFYTQVLHLMNKMNLPAPFGPITPSPPLQPDMPCEPQVTPEAPKENTEEVLGDVLEEEEMEVTSTEESELESDEDVSKKPKETVPVKRHARQPKKGLKKPKLQQLLKPPPSSSTTAPAVRTNPADVFDSPATVGGKKIQFNIKQSLEADATENVGKIDVFEELKNPVQVEEGGFGVIEPQRETVPEESDEDAKVESWDKSNFISSSELKKNRISEREMKSLSVFKNYQAGEPTSRLYVKNLAKQTNEKDLRFLYGRFINRHSTEEKNMFDIRVMKEGRMKGQAFITLFTDKQAISALKETNGYILRGKPLVVQFARSAKPKQVEAKKTS